MVHVFAAFIRLSGELSYFLGLLSNGCASVGMRELSSVVVSVAIHIRRGCCPDLSCLSLWVGDDNAD